MAHHYYRGDDRNLTQINLVGFQPKKVECRGRTSAEAVLYIKKLIKDNKLKSLADIGSYIIADAKGDSVSTSCILEGASFGNNKYKIECPGDAMYFEFNADGSVGRLLHEQGHFYGRKPYYILNNVVLHCSDYVVVGTRTATREATFFTDIPAGWISSV